MSKTIKIPVKYVETDHVFDISKAWYRDAIEITYLYDRINLPDDLTDELPF
jgi:hypothetical protein